MRAAIILVCLLATACGVTMKPGSEPRNRREIPPGPGIMSGEEGEFVIYRLNRTPPATRASDEAAEAPEEDASDAESGQ